ncbi:predicted protein [Naegleria gruberi]|uniref:Predicted protein n=1 Tax=Naegleria gruberi TaxID=5762 RepID=D2V289_NAEGR|nr:uncharacterized protein NAEGRDRAFT_46105 [Naegleria gruberi]EFC49014.1 predicted protein [Naegleria gruberi]|eukprot:XP_002681758.1 predicted protein [Naegleria gruberi strain NEG-M]
MGEILQILFAMVIQETLNCEGYLPTASSDGGATHQSTTTHLNIPNNTPQPNQFANHDGVKEEEQEEISCGETPSLEIYTPATSEPLTTWEQSNAVPSTSCALSTETIKSPSSQTVKEEPESE